ncbi:hypothetical protein NB311A_13446 [Nitrobacter sp. Nb-311A]|nr:hypothetical protein NB311A_13446 [Nitrobacter sp. Nb-311A]
MAAPAYPGSMATSTTTAVVLNNSTTRTSQAKISSVDMSLSSALSEPHLGGAHQPAVEVLQDVAEAEVDLGGGQRRQR